MKLQNLAFTGIIILLAGCRHSPEVPTTPILTFDQDVNTILLNNCATVGCHDGSKERRKLVTYSEVMRYVTAGQPYQSNLFTTTVSLAGNRMPPQGNMSDNQIKVIYLWILQGAREN